MTLFQKAVKREAKLRLAIAGPSGSGKTYTALVIGSTIGKVAVVDTEHGSASKYADIFDFDVLNLDPPYHPRRFVEAIRAASTAGYDVVILDSISHAWNGAGGVLEIVEQASKKFKGNSYAGWQEGTPVHNALIEGIVGAPIHVIATMRSKQDYILVERNGRTAPQKVGMAPVQRDGFEYEFDVFLDMDIENNAIVSKTRCSALTGKVISKPGKSLADTLIDWLSGDPVIKIESPKHESKRDSHQATLSVFPIEDGKGGDITHDDEWDDLRQEAEADAGDYPEFAVITDFYKWYLTNGKAASYYADDNPKKANIHMFNTLKKVLGENVGLTFKQRATVDYVEALDNYANEKAARKQKVNDTAVPGSGDGQRRV